VVNAVGDDATGTFDPLTGAASVSLPLVSRVYITGNTAAPCPRCENGSCSAGARAGMSCTSAGSVGTSLDCPPSAVGFQAPLPVDLSPLSTGTAESSDAAGTFCPGQTPGAFGQASARRISETGAPAGDLGDGESHPAALASVFCVPGTGNVAVDGVADLPGPGAIGLSGLVQMY
jgi:hypothetical protein